MKKTMTAILLGLLAGLMIIAPASADGAQWGDFFDADGKLLPGVIDGGEVSVPSDMALDLPFGIGGQMTYHVYTSPNGSTMLLPDASTLLAIGLSGGFSSVGADSLMLTGTGIIVIKAGQVVNDPLGTMAALFGTTIEELSSIGFTNEMADAMINGNGNVLSSLTYSDVQNLMKMFLRLAQSDHGNLYMAAMIYNSCTTSPTGCPTALCDSNPQACGLAANNPNVVVLKSCPGATVQQQSPVLSIAPVAPQNPLVIGQDPTKRGVDITASATLPPVIYTWYEPVFEEVTYCRPLNTGETGANCRVPGSPGWRNNGIRETDEVLVECRPHTEVLREQITNIQGTANIDPGTVAWITDYLGSIWYGAKVYQPSFNLGQYGSMSAGCEGSGVCSGALRAERVPFADPGKFNLVIRVTTNGTYFQGFQITRPRVISNTGEVHINVILPALIDAQ